MLDVATTTEGIALGGVETNPLLLTRGKISWTKLYVAKGLVCVAPIVSGEIAHRKLKSRLVDWSNIIGTAGGASYEGYVVNNNFKVLKILKGEGQ